MSWKRGTAGIRWRFLHRSHCTTQHPTSPGVCCPASDWLRTSCSADDVAEPSSLACLADIVTLLDLCCSWTLISFGACLPQGACFFPQSKCAFGDSSRDHRLSSQYFQVIESRFLKGNPNTILNSSSKMASMGVTVKIFALITVLLGVFAQHTAAKTHHYDFNIEDATFTRSCATVTVATVNGISPGPPIEITEGDTVVVTVTNKQKYPVTLHWHGIRQFLNNYQDGPAYITQCPILTGNSQIYQFTVDGQRGTFFYHAHITFLRATVHGALIVHPKKSLPPTYGDVAKEKTVIIGEWIGIDPEIFELGYIDTPNPALTASRTSVTPIVNGATGPLWNCSTGVETFQVQPHKTYLIRIINAALDNDYYFSVAGHKLIVVGADGNYLKPVVTTHVPIQPGQTIDVIIHTNQKPRNYYFGVDQGPVPLLGPPATTIPSVLLLEYVGATGAPVIPTFPNNTALAPVNHYSKKLRAYGDSIQHFPAVVDKDLIYAVGTAFVNCIPPEPCAIKIMGMVQNSTFDDPKGTNILKAYTTGQNGVFTNNIPDRVPSFKINLTTVDNNYFFGTRGTRVKELNFGDTVRIVLQNVDAAGIEDHPFHLHGHNFGVIGRGYGVYNPATEPKRFNLVDPPLFNTFGVPNGGWLAIQFVADNPGVWLMHCHFERHNSAWGMQTVFITKNGRDKLQRLPPSIHPLPQC